MKYCVVAFALLSAFVFAQAQKSSVVIENADDLNSNSEAKSAFCSIAKQCSDLSNNASIQAAKKIANRLDEIEKLFKQFADNLNVLSNTAPKFRYNDYLQISNLKPVFWLSGTFFDGFKAGADSSRTGVAPRTDVLGNPVTLGGVVPVTRIRGNMAYLFDRTNSIMSSVSVSNKFTFVVVYRYPAAAIGSEGRFFTSTIGNKLFAGWSGNSQELYIEGWINQNNVKTTDLVILIGTNDNGVKNLWTHDRQLVLNSRVGANDWGQVVIGRPVQFPNEAAQVNVYEAIVFDKVLDMEQQYKLLSVLKKWYNMK